MRELLEPIVGESGALVAQLLITTAVVLALIALVIWLVRRFGALRIGGIGRGRVPRLAIVDAMAIDNRRRLILLRRDAVEHLILIGGPADLLIESAIVRARQKAGTQPAQEMALRAEPPSLELPRAVGVTQPRTATDLARPAPPPPAASQSSRAVRFPENRLSEGEGAGSPIPFPTERVSPPRSPETINAAFHPFQRVATTASNGAGSDRDAFDDFDADAVPTDRPSLPPGPGDAPREPAGALPASGWRGAGFDEERPVTQSIEPRRRGANNDFIGGYVDGTGARSTTTDVDGSGAAARSEMEDMGGLEAEMARLLGEITSKRSSS